MQLSSSPSHFPAGSPLLPLVPPSSQTSDAIHHGGPFSLGEILYELRLSLQVSRLSCHKNKTYRVLSEKEGEEEVRLWRQRYLSLTKG